MAILYVMAVTTIKSTYSLDVETVRTLEALARRWNVSKSEVLRRAIRAAAGDENQPVKSKLEALDRWQASLKAQGVDFASWEREARAERRASSLKRMSAFDDPS